MDNNGRQAITTARWLSIFMLAFLSCLSACAKAVGPPQPPIKLSFEVQKAGNRVETEMRIVERKQYSFRLKFLYKDNDEGDRVRVKKLVGEDGQFKSGDPGIPTPLRFKISAIDSTGEKPMLEQEITEMRLTSWGSGSYDKIFAFVTLNPGHYRVSVESLKDAPELVGTTVAFMIGFRSKP